MPAPALPFRLPPPAAGRPDLLVIAGEHSGDEHAARMVHRFLGLRPEAKVCALGGPRLAAAGAQLLHDLTALSLVGLAGVLRHLSFFRALQAETVRWIAEHRPRAVCFVDYSGFNLRVAEALRARGISAKGGGGVRLLYYISPQIWASRARRRFGMARNLDALASIFPFEREAYADTALPVEFVGHPFGADDYAPPVVFDPAGPVLLLPGSRRQAVARIFPALLAAHRAAAERPAVVLYPSEEILAVLRGLLPEPEAERVAFVPSAAGPQPGAAVLTSSGTMSMHCALAGIPGAIAYRIDPLTYFLARWLVKVRYLGIANILLNEPMYPEYIQGAATAEALAGELRRSLHDPARRERTAAQAARLRGLLRQPAGRSAAAWLAGQRGV
ncbi:MAG TPA: lipid-A-disaccharide synthase, partial [Opitutaceae bacterium]|nr:lipid-A-disaccharide synthase [Opitutaceae bacterium]